MYNVHTKYKIVEVGAEIRAALFLSLKFLFFKLHNFFQIVFKRKNFENDINYGQKASSNPRAVIEFFKTHFLTTGSSTVLV